jgi:hypothetical protein
VQDEDSAEFSPVIKAVHDLEEAVAARDLVAPAESLESDAARVNILFNDESEVRLETVAESVWEVAEVRDLSAETSVMEATQDDDDMELLADAITDSILQDALRSVMSSVVSNEEAIHIAPSKSYSSDSDDYSSEGLVVRKDISSSFLGDLPSIIKPISEVSGWEGDVYDDDYSDFTLKDIISKVEAEAPKPLAAYEEFAKATAGIQVRVV